MYAVIKTDGKQYRVSPGEVIRLDKMEEQVGDQVEFDKVLAIQDEEQHTIGRPTIDHARVLGTVVETGRAKKIRVLKFKRRKAVSRPAGAPPGVHPPSRSTPSGLNHKKVEGGEPMAHKKGVGSSRNGRDSNAQRLGVKRFDGQRVTGGSILVRQRGHQNQARRQRRSRKRRHALCPHRWVGEV